MAQNCTFSYDGSSENCFGEISVYQAEVPNWVQEINWTLNGQVVGQEEILNFDWNNRVGEFDLCLAVLDSCAGTLLPPLCRKISVREEIKVDSFSNFCTGNYVRIFNQNTGRLDTSFSVAGIHQFTYIANNGCDSIVNYHLMIQPPPTIDLPDTSICQGDFIPLGTSFFNTTGRHCGQSPDEEGCITFICRNLVVRDSIKTSLSEIICPEDAPYEIWDTMVFNSSTFLRVFPAADGCDSTVTVNLTIREPIFSTRFDTICAEDCLPVGDTCFTESGRHRYLFKTAIGCDSTVTINLLVKKPKESFETPDLCAGDTLRAGPKFWIASGVFEYKTIAKDGCDSIITYDLTVKAPNQTFLNETICFGECYDFHPNVICQTGFYTVTYIANDECDSLVFLNLTVEEDLSSEFQETICDGETLTVGDSTISTTGYYEILLQGQSGCDSLVKVEVLAKEELVYEFEETICIGECYDKIQGTSICEEGIHEVLLETADGCDSLIILNLIIENDPNATRETIEVCIGDCIEFGDSRICVGGVYQFVYQSITGCDSTATIELVVKDSVHAFFAQTICLGDSVMVGNKPFFEEGDFTELITNAAGCDSVVNFTLTVLDCAIDTDVEIDSTDCNGINNGRIAFSVTEGIPPFTYDWQSPREEGRGSGIIEELDQEVIFENLAAGAYMITITDTFSNIAILNLEVLQPAEFEHEWDVSDYNGLNISCEGERDAFLEILPTGGTEPYAYKWNNGGVTSGLTDLAVGTYTVTVSDAMDCDFVATYAISSPQVLKAIIETANPICDSLATGKITVSSILGGTAPYESNLSGTGFSERSRYQELMPGQYDLVIKDANGCEVEMSADLPVPAIPELLFEKNAFISLGDSYEVLLESTVPIDIAIWEGPEGLSCYDCVDPVAQPLETSTYQVTATSPDGCVAMEELVVHVEKKRDVFVPNVFSPNGDGINDRLVIYGGPEVTNITVFRVYTRWGSLVFEGHNLNPNEEVGTWDGRFGGKRMRPGSFVWTAQIEFIDEVTLEYYGDVVLK